MTEPYCCLLNRQRVIPHVEAMRQALRRWFVAEAAWKAHQRRKLIPWRERKGQ